MTRPGDILFCHNVSRRGKSTNDQRQIRTCVCAIVEDELHGLAGGAAGELQDHAHAVSGGKWR